MILDTMWSIQQSPMYGDAYHTISFFRVSESDARQNTFPFEVKKFKSGTFIINETSNSVGVRRYVYLLPNSRLPKGEVANVKYNFKITSLSTYEPLDGMMYVFKQRQHLSDFEDCEPYAESNAVHCSCIQAKSKESGDVGCPKLCSATPEFTPGESDDDGSSYYFFTTQVPGSARVKYTVKMTMYFYNITALSKGFVCTIRGTDTCKISMPGYIPWRERMVVLAYVHPSTLSVPPTAQLKIEKEVDVWKTAALGVCVTTFAYLAIRFVCIVIFRHAV